MLETVNAAERALYRFLFSGSIFFFAICDPFRSSDILAKNNECRTRARKPWSRLGGRHELQNKCADRRRLVFAGVGREGIGPLKSIRSFHSQAPALRRPRSGNKHAPVALSPTERVLEVSGNVAAQLRAAETLQFDRNSHPVAILSTNCANAETSVVHAHS